MLAAIVALLLVAGLAARLYDLTNLPLDFQPTRQLHSALIARGIYYQNLASIPQWERDMAVSQWNAQGLIEPQIMEHLVAFTYRFTGETLWVARIYSILFWVLGGLALFWLARALTGDAGGLVALGFYLFVQYGVIASRAFMPDPLLVAMMCFALWAIYRWYRRRTWAWTLAAGILSGATIYIKTVGVFFIAGALVALVLFAIGLKKAIRDPQIWVLGALAVIPAAAYYYYGTFVLHLLQSQFSLRFFPSLWVSPVYYLRWLAKINTATGFWAFFLGLLGTFLYVGREKRALMFGLWGGYLIYGLAFAYFFQSHDYYQLPLIPLTALALAPLGQLIYERLRELSHGPFFYLPLIAIIVLGLGFSVRGTLSTVSKTDYRGQAAFWAKLGNELGHESSRTIALTDDYGQSMEYWGMMTPAYWMTTGDINMRVLAGQTFDIQEMFKEQTAGKDYFLVTFMDDFNLQPELKKLLSGYAILDQGPGYIIYDLRRPASG